MTAPDRDGARLGALARYAALDAAGLGRLRTTEDPIVFHDLRHTFGTSGRPGVPALRRQGDDGPRRHLHDHDLRAPRASTDAAARLSALLETGEGVTTPELRGLASSQSATSGAVPTP